MKTKIPLILFVVLLCLALCACGQNRSGRTDDGVQILPGSSAMPSPDWDDGVVRDQDGLIGNGDMGEPAPSTSPMPGADSMPGTSPMPSVSPMPTTAPSSSPNT